MRYIIKRLNITFNFIQYSTIDLKYLYSTIDIFLRIIWIVINNFKNEHNMMILIEYFIIVY